jgi:hypothetical protein
VPSNAEIRARIVFPRHRLCVQDSIGKCKHHAVVFDQNIAYFNCNDASDPFPARASWSSTTRTTMPAPSQKRTKLGTKALPGSRTNRLGIPPPIQATTLSQYVDAEASRDPLNEPRASHNKRRHNEINGSYNSDKENDSDVASEGTPAAAKVGLRRA